MPHSANFKRVVCPANLTQKSGCTRSDDKLLAAGKTESLGLRNSPVSSTAAAFAAMMLGVLYI
jgi:hypothetical protein